MTGPSDHGEVAESRERMGAEMRRDGGRVWPGAAKAHALELADAIERLPAHFGRTDVASWIEYALQLAYRTGELNGRAAVRRRVMEGLGL